MRKDQKRVEVSDAIDITGATVDVEAGIIRGVRLIGSESKNRDFGKQRRYSAAALENATKLYEGANVNVDHDIDDKGRLRSPGARRSGERIGIVENVTFVGGAESVNRGDLRLLKTHPLTPRFLEAAQDDKLQKCYSLSHAASCVGSIKDDSFLIESIEAVHSVDIVANGATNRGIFETEDVTHKSDEESTDTTDTDTVSTEAEDSGKEADMDWAAITLTDVRANRPDILESHRDEVAPDADETRKKLRATEAELDRFKTVAKTSEKRLRVERLCKDARLPTDAITETFVETLCEEADEKKIRALIEDRRQLVRGSARPRSNEQHYTEGESGNRYSSTVDEDECRKDVAAVFS